MPDTELSALPLLPLTSGVVLPHNVVTLALETDEARAAADAAAGTDGRLLLVPRVDGRFAAVGTVAQIDEAGDLPNGLRALIIRGLHRARTGAGLPGTGLALWVQVDPVAEPPATDRARELAREYRAVVQAILDHRGASRLGEFLRGIEDPGAVADTAGYSPDLSLEQKVEVLEAIDVEARLEKVLGWARDTLGELELKDRIRTEVTDGMERRQREFLLRQQLDAIRKELGEDGDDAAGDYRRRVAELDLPEAVQAEVERELDRFERAGDQSPESAWIRTWLDTMIELPWGVRTDDTLDVAAARRVLDEDHTGLADVKDRIVELLAVRRLRAERGLLDDAGRGSGAILTLVGPPGVGKTSHGESVARAMGRRFVRVALGGIRDEAEIRGHRRTYVGALPGRIARALREAGSMNPVILLDEVDKVGSDWRGDPSSALLEVLDPAQNSTFRDHYLGVDLDLSDVLFLATANVVETIPGPLLDRMEVLRLDGYTDDEKVVIATGHLLPRQRRRAGLHDGEVVVTDAAVRAVVRERTREAGVRSLERELGTLLRKVATRLAGGEVEPPVTVDGPAVRTWLGRPRFVDDPAARTSVPGVATGLAVTGAGGDVLFVEATSMPGEPALKVTGQLGEVMRESAEIALSFVRSSAGALGLPDSAFDDRRFHIHFPAGAVPKDGPSAGVTMTTALASLLSGRLVRSDVGMTGEVTLSGRVLPIGGVKQKLLAADRAGLTTVVLPAGNEGDLEDLPADVRERLTVHLVDDVLDVVGIALEPAVAVAA